MTGVAIDFFVFVLCFCICVVASAVLVSCVIVNKGEEND